MKLFQAVFVLLSSRLGIYASPVQRSLAPLYKYPNSVKGEYIVSFNNPEVYTVNAHLARVEKSFWTEWLGIGYYARGLTIAQVDTIRSDPNVKCVEPNTKTAFKPDAMVPNVGPRESGTMFSNATLSETLIPRAEQQKVGYGLEYLSATKKFPSGGSYFYQEEGGKGVDVYVMDSGVNKLANFGGRVENDINVSADFAWGDDLPGVPQGHGTSVASVIASRTYGSSKMATIRVVKFLDHGSITDRRANLALYRILGRHMERRRHSQFRGSIINMSFGLQHDSLAIQSMFQKLTSQGVVIVASAGNHGSDSKYAYPCYSKYTICVGAVNIAYQRSAISNYGTSVDILAPGEKVTGLDAKGNVAILEGTSFSAPYVSGILANFYSWEGRPLTVDRARMLLKLNADPGFLDAPSLRGNPNLLANSGYKKTSGGRPYLGAPDKQYIASADPSATSPAQTTPPPICSIPQTMQVLPLGSKALCKCTDGSLYPLSPITSTTVFNKQTSTTVDQCPYTILPTRRSLPALPPHTPVVIGSLTLAKPLPAASTPLVPPTSTKPAPSLACTDSAHCP